MDSIIDALFKDPVIKRLSARQPASRGSSLPAGFVARVISLKGDVAELRWQGGTLNASLDAPVSVGERLLLQLKGSGKQKPAHYRIMARFPDGAQGSEHTGKEAGEPVSLGLISSSFGGEGQLPALIRFFPEGARAGEEAKGEPLPFLELMIETESFGLILVRFFRHGADRLECRFIVESNESGLALEREAARMIGAGKSGKNDTGLIRWSVEDLRSRTAELLSSAGRGLNARA